MLLIPAALSAGAVPLVRRHPAAAWTLWGVMAVATLAATVLLGLVVAFVQTVAGAAVGLSEGDPEGSRGHVDLALLVPWTIAALVATGGSGIAVVRRHTRARTRGDRPRGRDG